MTGSKDENPFKNVMFHNISIKINNQTIFYSDWLLHGVKHLNGVVDEAGEFQLV